MSMDYKAHLVSIIDAVLISIVVTLLGVGAYFGFWYHPLRDDFKISVLTEGEPKAGEKAAIIVRLANAGKSELKDAVLTVSFPPQFRPEAAYGGPIEIASIPPRSSAEFRFRGLLIGPPQSVPVYAHLTARTDDGRTDEKLATGALEWEKNLFEATFDVPRTVVAGQTLTFKLRLKNGAGRDFEEVVVRPSLPPGFALKTSSPPLHRQAFFIGQMKAGEAVEVDISGSYDGRAPSFNPSVDVYWIEKDRETLIAEASAEAQTVASDLALSAAYEKSLTGTAPGQTVAFTLRYDNRGTYTLRNVKFAAAFDPRVAEQPLTEWPAIPAIAPGESGTLDGTVRVRSRLSEYVVNPVLTLTPQATFTIDEPAVEATVQHPGPELKVAGTARLEAAARYFTAEGDQIGRGPLPPRVGKTTRYWIFAAVETGASAVKNAAVSFRLPANVRWTGRAATNLGEIVADPAFDPSVQVGWVIGDIPAHAGISSPALNASIEVALTPDAGQVGSPAPLLLRADFNGADTWTPASLTASVGTLTTLLPSDASIRGRTAVKP